MKTTITTIAIVIASVLLNVSNAFAKNEETIYRNEVVNEETRTSTITLCKGENGLNLYPVKQYTIQYDEMGNPIEKVISKWDGYGKWLPVQKYSYTYNDGQLAMLSLINWNDLSRNWGKKIVSTINNGQDNEILLTNK